MRISVVGCSGSGKTTLARRIAERTGITHVELDALHHLEDWTPNPEFRRVVEAALNSPRWVCDGNYSVVADLVRGRADTIVVLDLPRWRVMAQIVPRTLGRSLLRRELWNGNREGLGNFLRWDPEQNIIRWAWTRYHPVRRRYLRSRENGDWDHAEVVWLRSRHDADLWVDSLPPDQPKDQPSPA